MPSTVLALVSERRAEAQRLTSAALRERQRRLFDIRRALIERKILAEKAPPGPARRESTKLDAGAREILAEMGVVVDDEPEPALIDNTRTLADIDERIAKVDIAIAILVRQDAEAEAAEALEVVMAHLEPWKREVIPMLVALRTYEAKRRAASARLEALPAAAAAGLPFSAWIGAELRSPWGHSVDEMIAMARKEGLKI